MNIQEAKEYGRDAYISGLNRVPALDKDFIKNFCTIKVGNANDYLNAWIEGWDTENLKKKDI